ncbi:hypothetical protein WJX74_002250 [Apatococcus lobatus]|uniref:Uncharacterized protein n=1 Tax=Apatococcus lobatus TaxID=904363 RepID=A0AAW1Q6Y2_9CHLO
MMDVLPNGLSLRIHAETNEGSVIDVIRAVRGKTISKSTSQEQAKDASNAWSDIKRAHPDLGAQTRGVRINGKGHETPVARAPVLVEIVWKTPGEGAREFLRACAGEIWRLMTGDEALIPEIQARNAAVGALPQDQQDFLRQGHAPTDTAAVQRATGARGPSQPPTQQPLQQTQLSVEQAADIAHRYQTIDAGRAELAFRRELHTEDLTYLEADARVRVAMARHLSDLKERDAGSEERMADAKRKLADSQMDFVAGKRQEIETYPAQERHAAAMRSRAPPHADYRAIPVDMFTWSQALSMARAERGIPSYGPARHIFNERVMKARPVAGRMLGGFCIARERLELVNAETGRKVDERMLYKRATGGRNVLRQAIDFIFTLHDTAS